LDQPRAGYIPSDGKIEICQMAIYIYIYIYTHTQSDTKKWELLKNPTKIKEIQEKEFIDRN